MVKCDIVTEPFFNAVLKRVVCGDPLKRGAARRAASMLSQNTMSNHREPSAFFESCHPTKPLQPRRNSFDSSTAARKYSSHTLSAREKVTLSMTLALNVAPTELCALTYQVNRRAAPMLTSEKSHTGPSG